MGHLSLLVSHWFPKSVGCRLPAGNSIPRALKRGQKSGFNGIMLRTESCPRTPRCLQNFSLNCRFAHNGVGHMNSCADELFRGRYLKVQNVSGVSLQTKLMTSLRPLDLLESSQWVPPRLCPTCSPTIILRISLLSYQSTSLIKLGPNVFTHPTVFRCLHRSLHTSYFP